MKLPHWTLTLVVAMAAGCHSIPALHYYALDTVAPASSPTRPGFATLIHVRHIGLPHEMDHLGLTYHAGPTRLAISDTDQWSAPLAELIQGALHWSVSEIASRVGPA